MCGIVGMIGLNGRKADPTVIQAMTSSLLHRGPDDGAIKISDSVGFGFRRLAILDLSPAANQPMVSGDGKLILVFNGEIFNYVEIRNELQALGHTFKSSGDTEVLLHAYGEWGRECLHKLNGMWAFVIYDLNRNVLFGSRDRFGIKPLYYYRDQDYALFGSEIKAILASRLYRNKANWKIIADFLLEGRLDQTNESFYEGILQLPSGTAFEISLDGEMKIWRYWSVGELAYRGIDDPVGLFADIFEDSVRLHMRSDVPVGVCLSGGLDSTSIICAVARLWNGSSQPLLAFSYNAAEFDESSYVADTIRQTQARLKQLQTGPLQLWDSLAKVLSFHDEPVYSMTALVGFELMGLAAANGVKVVLNGQGSDETVAGYPSFFRDYWYTLLRDGRIREVWKEIDSYKSAHEANPATLFLNVIRHLLQVELSRARAYRRLARWKQRKKVLGRGWFTGDLAGYLTGGEYNDDDWTLNAVLRRSIERAPLPFILRVEDRNSMAHSVEARLPFLDFRLVSLAFNMAANWKMRGPWNKYILREAMRERIPESVRSRVDKMGFPVPARKWFSSVLYERVRDVIESREVRERGIYNVGEIRRDLERHREGEIDVSDKLFDLVQIELWSQLGEGYSNRDSRVSIPAEAF
jgi:asparagine synthase (glutamine-hydrolysing)